MKSLSRETAWPSFVTRIPVSVMSESVRGVPDDDTGSTAEREKLALGHTELQCLPLKSCWSCSYFCGRSHTLILRATGQQQLATLGRALGMRTCWSQC